MPISNVYNMDCMEGMKAFPDKFFDLAIVDPPYGLGNRLSDGGGKLKNTPMAVLYRDKDWDVLPNIKYWDELNRVSKNQIICGGNYFSLPPSRGFVIWDKKQAMPTLSACEFIWTSFDCPSKVFYSSSTDLERMHPTQKPIGLYKFLINRFAITGNKLLDTHLGSQSSRIAAYKLGFDFWGYEIDEDYFKQGCERFDKAIAEPLFDAVKVEQQKIF